METGRVKPVEIVPLLWLKPRWEVGTQHLPHLIPLEQGGGSRDPWGSMEHSLDITPQNALRRCI